MSHYGVLDRNWDWLSDSCTQNSREFDPPSVLKPNPCLLRRSRIQDLKDQNMNKTVSQSFIAIDIASALRTNLYPLYWGVLSDSKLERGYWNETCTRTFHWNMPGFIHFSNVHWDFNGVSCVHVSSQYPLSNLLPDIVVWSIVQRRFQLSIEIQSIINRSSLKRIQLKCPH